MRKAKGDESMQPNYNFYGYNPYQQQQFNNQLIFIQNIEEAQNYIVHSNRPVYFRLNNGQESMFIEKRVDTTGNVIIEYYTKVQPQNSNTQMQYVALSDFEQLKNDVKQLQAIIMAQSKKVETNTNE